jgi:autotransporter-associated beta strand protein
MTFNGVIAGPGALTKLSANTLTLGGANTYAGTTTISGGTLSLGGGGPTGSLSTSGAIVDNANLTINRGNTVTQGIDFSGSAITGSGSLTQAGAGTLILNAANTYSGGTTVSAGTLSAGGTAALGLGNVTVQGTTAGTSLAIQTGVGNAISDSAILSLAGGGTLGVPDQGYANLGSGVAEIVGSLLLGGVAQTQGLTYGSSSSNAAVQSDEFFAGAGAVSVGLPGDFNDDGSVDASDYVAWRVAQTTYGGSAGYDVWRANFGNTSPGEGSGLSPSGSGVPEPSSVLLLMLGLAAMVQCDSNRRRAPCFNGR